MRQRVQSIPCYPMVINVHYLLIDLLLLPNWCLLLLIDASNLIRMFHSLVDIIITPHSFVIRYSLYCVV